MESVVGWGKGSLGLYDAKAMAENSARVYRLGREFRDTGTVRDPDDQFLRWLNADGRGIRNMGGIRPIKFRRIDAAIPAAIVLVTHHASRGSSANPWEDLVDLQHGRIVYWGDAKFHATNSVDDWVGNRALRVAFGLVLDNVRHLVPPILHFSKTSSGYTRFNGLCVLDQLELTWFEDAGRPVRNYRAHLSILDQESVDAAWIYERADTDSLDHLRASGPGAWRHYLAGRVNRLRVWAPSVRTQLEQLPPAGSPEERILGELTSMTPTGF